MPTSSYRWCRSVAIWTLPRSLCVVSCPGMIPCRSRPARMIRFDSVADSRCPASTPTGSDRTYPTPRRARSACPLPGPFTPFRSMSAPRAASSPPRPGPHTSGAITGLSADCSGADNAGADSVPWGAAIGAGGRIKRYAADLGTPGAAVCFPVARARARLSQHDDPSGRIKPRLPPQISHITSQAPQTPPETDSSCAPSAPHPPPLPT